MTLRIDEALADGISTRAQCAVADVLQLAARARDEHELFRFLVAEERLPEEVCYEVWAESLGLPYFPLRDRRLDRELVHRLPLDLARKHGAIPVREMDGELTIALKNPLNIMAIDSIQEVTGVGVSVAVASPSSIDEALARMRRRQAGIEGLLARVERSEIDADLLNSPGRLKDLVGEDAVVQVVDFLVEEALGSGASDLHVEPMRDGLRIRLRIDGRLEVFHQLPAGLRSSVCSRLKVMAGMDIGENRKPQDGRFVVADGVEVRVSCLPATFGEKLVLRILDRRGLSLDTSGLGMTDANLEMFRDGFTRSHGLVLLTGPTGSGKTTTLYSALHTVNKESVNVVTVEDPVEYELKGCTQVQVDAKAGRTFAQTLRAILRQDPDVVMVGEIRDAETAGIAVEAALTGHLVLSTLHTNDAPSAVHRLLDMGVPAYLVGPALRCIVGQRLIPRLCTSCARPREVGAELVEMLNLSGSDLSGIREGVGCDRCRGHGFRGRVPIHEVLSVDGHLRQSISSRANDGDLVGYARQNGYRTLLQDGVEKACSGLVSLEEVLSVARS